MNRRYPPGVDMSPAAVTARLRHVASLSDLTPERRLDAKLDLSPAGITRRLAEASDLLQLCQTLAASRGAPVE
jgi:hypothetical protein